MFKSKFLNQIIDAIPQESGRVKRNALLLFVLIDDLLEQDLECSKEVIYSVRDIQNVMKDDNAD